jgi:hypothetical protein
MHPTAISMVAVARSTISPYSIGPAALSPSIFCSRKKSVDQLVAAVKPHPTISIRPSLARNTRRCGSLHHAMPPQCFAAIAVRRLRRTRAGQTKGAAIWAIKLPGIGLSAMPTSPSGCLSGCRKVPNRRSGSIKMLDMFERPRSGSSA